MKTAYLLFALGLLLRLVLMVTAIHPDFRAVNLAASFIVDKGEITSFYDHISRLPRSDWLVQLYGDNLFIYPPLAYLFHAPFYALLHALYPASAWSALINDIGLLRATPGSAQLLFLLKLPYLLVDVLGCIALYKYLPDRKKATSASLFWWFNPVLLYVAYGIGQFDILIAVSLLFALLSKRPSMSAFWVGIAACFKPFPLVLLPFLPGSKVKNLCIGAGVYGLSLLPYLSSPAFKMYALFADQSSKLLFAKVYVSATQYVSLFIVAYGLLFAARLLRPKLLPTYGWLGAVLLLFYMVTNFHPQWFLWFVPISVFVFLASSASKKLLLALLVCYTAIVFSFEPSLHLGLFGIAAMPYMLFSRLISPDELVSLFRSFFALTSLLLLYRISTTKHSL